MLKPKLFSIIKHRKKEYNKIQLLHDFTAGLIVAIIALPLSVALGIASGVSPEKGLITAIIAGFLVSFLGGSRVQIGGPTGAFVVIVYGIIENYGLAGLITATIMAGVFLIIFGLLGFGSIINFIPQPIITGFTTGIAVVLFSTQIKDFLGLNIEKVPSEFFEKWHSYITHLSSASLPTIAVGILSLLIIIYWPKINRTIPGSLIALLFSIFAVKFLNLNVATIGSVFGELSSAFPAPTFQPVDFKTLQNLMPPAITIAMLAGIESLLSAVVADGMIGKKHNSNMELIAQGVANIGSALFGGIPATGAIARTAANVKNGGRTPIAGIVHSFVLLLIMLLLMPYAKLIPMCTLAAILMVVSYNMSEWRVFKFLLKSPKSDIAILVTTFVLTVAFDLVIAIEIGMIIAVFLFMKKMSDTTKVNCLTPSDKDNDDDEDDYGNNTIFNLEKNISIYEINGPLFFGAVNTFLGILNNMNKSSDILILRMKNVQMLDASAVMAIKQFDKQCRNNHILILYSELQEKPFKVLENANFVETTGRDRFFDSIEAAVKTANELVNLKKLQPIKTNPSSKAIDV